MADIICPQCGYENPEGSVICDICAEPLGATEPPVPEPEPVRVPAPAPSAPPVQAQTAVPGEGREYFVFCPESQTRTMLPDGNVTRFFCEGCRVEHEIDDFLWQIESRNIAGESAPAAVQTPEHTGGDELWLEELNTRFRIDIAKPGGTLGRYGTFGSQYFLSNNMHTVSGEHCRITYEYGTWVLRHISNTNSTHYNGFQLEREEPNMLEDGKLLTLANTVTFRVHIG